MANLAYADGLDAQQLAVVEETGRHVICCAVPGSGKTKVLVAKIAHLLMTAENPTILATTFTKDAAEEILARVKKVVPQNRLRLLRIGTTHALMRAQTKALGPLPRILSEVESVHLLHEAMRVTRILLAPEDAAAIVEAFKVDRKFAEENAKYRSLVQEYQRLLTEKNACDFTDLMIRCIVGMDQGRIQPYPARYVLVDEIQDYCRAQYAWLYHHLHGAVSTLLGDDDQAVYGFRRSLGYKGMMEFKERTGAIVMNLETNYRSTGGILASATSLIRHNLDRVPKQIVAARGAGPRPELRRANNGKEQAEDVVARIVECCRDNPLPPSPPNASWNYVVGVRQKQVAVLARTNAGLRTIEDAFSRKIPFIRLGRSIWDDKVLQVFFAMLLALHNRDNVGLEVALKWAQVPETSIRELTDDGRRSLWTFIDPGVEPLSAFSFSPVVGELIRRLRGLRTKLKRGGDDEITTVIRACYDWFVNVLCGRCRIEEILDDEEETEAPTRWHPDFTSMWKVTMAMETLSEMKGGVQHRLMMAKKCGVEGVPRVILATFHGAKGLEWDHVFLVDVHEGNVPRCGPEAGDETIEEERRLFYVAMTRARDSLTIYTRAKPRQVSEFLHDAELLKI